MPDAKPSSRFLTRRALLRGLGAGLFCVAGAAVANILAGPNVHTVIPGAVYRSSQLSPARLESLIKQHGIRTVVNFRGCCEEARWYRDECRVTSSLGVSQEDLNGSSASRLPSVHTIRELVAIFDRAEYPLLFHCNRGIDRTGMASAIALLLKTDTPIAEARKQLGLLYGHLPVGKTGNIDRFFDLYENWLAQGHGPHSSDVFHRWMTDVYCPGPYRAEITAQTSPKLPAWTGCGFRIRCTNTSIEPWRFRPGSNAGVHAVFRVEDEYGELVNQGRSGLFNAIVAPGASIDLTLALAPLPPGKYILRADMADEQHGFFLQVGSEPMSCPLEVR